VLNGFNIRIARRSHIFRGFHKARFEIPRWDLRSMFIDAYTGRLEIEDEAA
jgi:hypothetical protein